MNEAMVETVVRVWHSLGVLSVSGARIIGMTLVAWLALSVVRICCVSSALSMRVASRFPFRSCRCTSSDATISLRAVEKPKMVPDLDPMGPQ
jgi:hypothetical protein